MKQAARWTAIIALFAIPFLPLYVASDLFFPFITGKNFAFRVLVEVAFAAYILLAVMDRRYRPKFSWILIIFAGFVVWMAIANLLGVHPQKAFWSNFERMDGWVTLVHAFILFVVAGAILTIENLWRRWWIFFVTVAALVCGYGLLQVTGAVEVHQGGTRLDAALGNAIYLAVYLMFATFAAAWLAVTSRGWLRNVLVAFMALAALILFFTGSRGPLVGLVGGMGFGTALWVILSARDAKDAGARTAIRLGVSVLAALIVATGTLFAIRDSSFVRESFFLSRAASVFSLNEELKVRGTIWGLALEGVKEDPLTGWGQEGFNQVFNKYYEPSLYEQESWFDRAHNTYLDWLVAGGVPAFVLFAALILLGAFGLLRAPLYSREVRVILMSALVAYAIQALVVFDNLFSYIPLVLLLAMAHAAAGRRIKILETLPELRSNMHTSIVAGGIAVLAVVLIWTVNVPGIMTAKKLIVALTPTANLTQNLALFKDVLAQDPFASQEVREQLVMFAGRVADEDRVPSAIKEEYAALAIAEMEKEVAKSPNDARLHVMFAQAYETAGDKERSLAQIEEAIALSPKKQSLHLNRAYKLYELGRIEESKEAFAYAYELDPSFDSVAISAASGYLLVGDVAGAKEILLEAVGTTTPDSDSLFYAYYEAKQWNELVGVARARVDAENGSAKSRYRLAQALAASRRFAEARAEISATIAAYPETRAQGEALLAQIPTLR